MISWVEGRQPLSLLPFFISHHRRYRCPLNSPKGSHILLDYNRNAQQYLPLPGSEKLRHSASVNLQSLTWLCVGVLKLNFLWNRLTLTLLCSDLIKILFNAGGICLCLGHIDWNWCSETISHSHIVICWRLPFKIPTSAASCNCLFVPE